MKNEHIYTIWKEGEYSSPEETEDALLFQDIIREQLPDNATEEDVESLMILISRQAGIDYE